ncbi:dienelactone hydrolase family protein [Amycolatopsis benzoatilytica]|uniref:dienelactone hydrolase family protein n=1 Tax=Amycolatopsis benzoatilytica TaxID=346045 RepID=UPI000376E36D|nr:dienelactone hydrolase family protein [Amycolatopsis benzoatilytica]
MRKEKVDVPAGDGTAEGYLVVPDGGPHPGVLLFMDAFGLRPRIEEMADRIAEAGYAVLAPDLLYRGGRGPRVDMSALEDPERRGAEFAKLMPLLTGLDVDSMKRDAEKYLDWFAGQDGVAEGPVVITGYCMGGTQALRVIEAFPDRVKAIASFHGGRLATDAPDSPHLAVGSITGEVYFGHADQDPSITAEQIKVLENALDEAGVPYQSEVYEGATHGYTMSDTAAYHEEGEKRHWENLFALLERVR